jgi:hypothetical protein
MAVKRPFAIALYKWRRERALNRIHPLVWLAPGRLLQLDLDLFEDKEGKFLTKELLDDLAKTRDALFERMRKQWIVSVLVFIFLAANYFAINLDFSISGFSLKFAPGIREGLLLLVNIIGVNTLMLQSNIYALDSAIRFLIAKVFPEELHNLYIIRYFAHEHYPAYNPFNLPHITPTNFTSNILIYGFSALGILVVITSLAATTLNIFIVFDMWRNPAFGIWSKVIGVYIMAMGLVAVIYTIITRLRLPYRDFTANHELEILEQVDLDRHARRREELYREATELYIEMVRRGYIAPDTIGTERKHPDQRS